MSYQHSTQFLHWLFTPDALASKCAARHAASVARVAAALSAAQAAGSKRPRAEEAASPAAEGAPAPQKRLRGEDGGVGGGGSGTSGGALPYLTLEEEELLLQWASAALLRLCRCAGLDRAVTATALMFFRRFYVAGLLVEYPPHEMLTPAVFLAIKVEACPYTEFDELTRRRLAPMDASWTAECEAALSGALAGGCGGGAPPPPPPPADVAAKWSVDAEPAYLRNEVPLLKGLQFQLTVYHGYRPLAALLRRAVADAAAAGLSLAGGAAPHSAPWVAAWDALQARAFAAVDAAALTTAPLLATPAHVALGALAVAADASAQLARGHALLGAAGAGGAHGGGDGHGDGAPLLPALAAPPDAALAAWVAPWAEAHAGEAGGSDAVRAVAGAVGALLALPPPPARRSVEACLLLLAQARDQSLVPGTPAHGARLERLRAAVGAYKAGKTERARAAAEALRALWGVENTAWGVASLGGGEA